MFFNNIATKIMAIHLCYMASVDNICHKVKNCCVIRCETSMYVPIIIILYSFVFWVESREKER